MIGSAVHVTDEIGKIRFAGTLIEFNELTNEFLVIDSTPATGIVEYET